mgnify:CR=1 FL=1
MQNKIDLKDFQVERILNRNDDRKTLILLGLLLLNYTISWLGKLKERTEPGILILEKKPFPPEEKVSDIPQALEKTVQYFEVVFCKTF